jgi:hypothetical protein
MKQVFGVWRLQIFFLGCLTTPFQCCVASSETGILSYMARSYGLKASGRYFYQVGLLFRHSTGKTVGNDGNVTVFGIPPENRTSYVSIIGSFFFRFA